MKNAGRIFIILFLALNGNLLANVQNGEDENLLRQQVDSLIQIMVEKEPHSGEEEGAEALQLARKINYKIAEATILLKLGSNHGAHFREEEAFECLEESLVLFQQYGSEKQVLQVMYWKTVAYRFFHRYKQALEQGTATIELAEKLRDSSILARTLMNVGDAHMDMQQKDKFLDYAKRAAVIQEKIGQLDDLARSLIFIGLEMENVDSCFWYFSKVEKLLPKLKGIRKQLTTLWLNRSMAEVHLRNKNYLGIEAPANKAMTYARLTSDEEGIAKLQYYLAQVQLYVHGNFQEAIVLADSSLKFERSISKYNDVVPVAKFLSLVHSKSSQLDKALEFSNLAAIYQDSLYKANKRDEFAQLQTEFELEQQESDIQLLEQQRKNRTTLGTSAIAFLLLLFGFYYRQHYLKSKHLKIQEQLTKQLQQDKGTIEIQAAELQQLDDLKSRFFANVSHELRTPLTLIITPLTQILKKENLNTALKKQLKSVLRNSKSLRQLVEEILDLTKLEANQLDLETKTVTFHPFLRQCLANFESLADHRQIHLNLDYGLPPKLNLELDAEKLKTVLNNLISNALKFTPIQGRILVKANELNGQIQIQVSDNGMGIHSDDLSYIFDRFYQSKQPESSIQGGTGIGLALCREYMQMMNGSIEVESQERKGTTFTIQFPKITVKDALETSNIDLPETIAAKEPLFTNGSLNSEPSNLPKLLIVEDNPDMQTLLEQSLQAEFQILKAFNGKEALEILAKEADAVQLILSDLMMPHMNGYQLLEALKKEQKYRQIPVLMLTARAEQRDKLQALRFGVDDYLTKPFEVEELQVRIQNLIAHYEERKSWQQFEAKESEQNGNGLPSDSAGDSSKEWLLMLEEEALKIIQEPTFNIPYLAVKVGASERGLYRLIKQQTGLTPNQYLTELRLNRAKQLLENKDHTSVEKVSFAVGINTPKYFVRLYQKRFGLHPKEYFDGRLV